MLERWTLAVLRARGPVVAAWLAVAVAGVWAETRLEPLLAQSFAVPGTGSERARAILTREFGDRTDGGFVVVFHGRAPARELRVRLAAAARAVPTGQAGPLRASGGISFADVDTTLELHEAKAYTDDVRRAVVGTPPALVTGQPAIQHDLDPIVASDLRRGEALALPAALLILVAVLGASIAIAIPFVFAACTITATLAAVWVLAHHLTMVSYVTNLVELIGLGLAIDYSLLLVLRFREELARGDSADDAVVRTMATAGRAVLFSGTTVAIGLALLFFVPVPFVRSMGIAGFLIPVAAMAAALTLQPALLSLLGTRVRGRSPAPVGSGFWARLARRILRRPFVYLALGTAALLAAAAPALGLRVTPGSLSALPGGLESVRAVELLRSRVGAGAAAPAQVVVDTGVDGGARGARTQRAVGRLAAAVARDPEVAVVASGRRPPYVDASGRYARVVIAARDDYGEQRTRDFVQRLRAQLIPRARFPGGAEVSAGGAPPQGVDFLERAYGAFPWLVAAVLVLTYIALLRAFRSLLLPLKAVLLNVLTVAATYGLLAMVFDAPIEGWIPIFLFAVVFGLSMDYEVFIVSRMREAWDETHDSAYAIAHGLERSGRVVTAAAAIMVVAFAGFVVGRVEGLRQFGAGLVLAVAIDATLVRAILVPSFMAVLGRWNWWLPRRPGKP